MTEWELRLMEWRARLLLPFTTIKTSAIIWLRRKGILKVVCYRCGNKFKLSETVRGKIVTAGYQPGVDRFNLEDMVRFCKPCSRHGTAFERDMTHDPDLWARRRAAGMTGKFAHMIGMRRRDLE